MDNYKFRVEFLEDAKQFLDELDEKARKLMEQYFQENKEKGRKK